MTQPTQEQKQRIFDLITELRSYTDDLPKLISKPLNERKKIAKRMDEIKIELLKFRRDYPDA